MQQGVPKPVEHTFPWTSSLSSLEDLVRKSCRKPCKTEILAHDPTTIPPLRIVNVTFGNVEDRDRMRITLRIEHRIM